jgi:hypothetical protein
VAAIGFGGVGSGSSEISVRQFSAGAIIGMVAHRDRDFRIIPTGGLSIINEKVTVGTRDNSETFFTLNMGAGIVVNSVWTIRPMISMPFNDDSNRDDTMSLGVWYNFGRRAPAR